MFFEYKLYYSNTIENVWTLNITFEHLILTNIQTLNYYFKLKPVWISTHILSSIGTHCSNIKFNFFTPVWIPKPKSTVFINAVVTQLPSPKRYVFSIYLKLCIMNCLRMATPHGGWPCEWVSLWTHSYKDLGEKTHQNWWVLVSEMSWLSHWCLLESLVWTSSLNVRMFRVSKHYKYTIRTLNSII